MKTLALLPAPQKLQKDAGQFVITDRVQTFYHPQFAAQAELLAERIRRATGLEVPISQIFFPQAAVSAGGHPGIGFGLAAVAASGFGETELQGGHFCLIGDPSLEAEEYRVGVEPSSVRLMASTPTGMAHAVHTTLQLFPSAVFSQGPRIGIAWALPCVRIQDKPLLRWRGAMLDCVRHFIPMPVLRRFIDIFALHHFNILQLHLTDDQGWRVEIKALPKLTEIGSVRPGTMRGHARSGKGFDGIPHGGFYTQQELGELVTYAEVRGITLVPEIDFPGHSTAALAAYPQLASGGPPATPACEFGILPHALFPSEKNLEFIAPAYEELMELFPGPYFHIGGDELKLERWNADPRTPGLLRRYGLGNVAELQPWFTRHLHALAARHGKRIVGWDEIGHEELPSDAIIMSWRGESASVGACPQLTVAAPYTHTYFDYYQSFDIESEPLAIEGVTTLEKTYSFDPLGMNKCCEPDKLFGVQGQLWTEYQPTPHSLEYMAFPRFCALAEVGWLAAARRDFTDFYSRLERHLKRFDVAGVAYRNCSLDENM